MEQENSSIQEQNITVLENQSTEQLEQGIQEREKKPVSFEEFERLRDELTSYKEQQAEAEKLKKMNTDEKVKYEAEKQLKSLEERENLVAKKELKITAHSILAEKGLSPKLLDILDYTSADTCKDSIDNIQGILQECIQLEVEKRLKSGVPNSQVGTSNSLETQIKNAMGIK